MNKFYILEEITQEDLNNLALERNTLKQENEKLNHYKLLYQKVKERNDKAIEYVEWYINDNKDFYKNKNIGLTLSETDGLLEILKGNNE